jgi:hypothetical protein
MRGDRRQQASAAELPALPFRLVLPLVLVFPLSLSPARRRGSGKGLLGQPYRGFAPGLAPGSAVGLEAGFAAGLPRPPYRGLAR